jgi:sugar phosphate isomerase/epimerase
VIPEFRNDGYLPNGVHICSVAEATFRFGGGSRRRKRLIVRLRRWIELAKQIGARRLLLDGSFVTSKDEPDDVDAVLLLSSDFALQLDRASDAALELEEMLLNRQPEELFAAEDEIDWQEWVEFFSQTREPDGRRKGLVEIQL